MKLCKSLTYIAFVCALTTACTKNSDFLKENMLSNTSVNNYYKTPNDFENALTGAYATISNGGLTNHDDFTRGLLIAQSVGTDEYASRFDWGDGSPTDMMRLGRLSATPLAPSYLPGIWQVLYAGINRSNLLLDKIEGVDFPDETQKNRLKAEASFLRGFYLLYASQLWGAVPLPLHSSVDNWLAPRSSLQEVYTQVEKDLTMAYQTLSASSTRLGRANKYVAGAFLTKMYVYLASCKENKIGDLAPLNADGKNLNGFDWVDAAAYWQKADNIVKDIYQNSAYKLIPDYAMLFYPTTKEQQYKEFLFEAECEQVQAWYLPGDFLVGAGDWPTNGGSGSGMRPPTEMAMKYDTADLRYKHNIISYIPNVIDSRFAIEKVGGKDFAIPLPFKKDTLDNISVAKVRQTMPYEYTIPAWAGVQNIPIIRFAEIILWYAETRYKMGDEATARNLLKELRMRAAGGDGQLSQELTAQYYKSDFMQEILDERSRELIGEGQRRIDLIRTGKFKTALFSIGTDQQSNGFFNQSWKTIQQNYADNKIWFPIIQNEIAVNPKLVQNPGY